MAVLSIELLLAVGVGDDFQPLLAVEVGHHRVEEARHGPFRLGEERRGRELVAMLDLPHPFVEEVAAQGQPQRHQGDHGQQADLEPVIAQGKPPFLRRAAPAIHHYKSPDLARSQGRFDLGSGSGSR